MISLLLYVTLTLESVKDWLFFPILSALYLLPIFHIFENHLKNLNIPISVLSFVDNGLFIS